MNTVKTILKYLPLVLLSAVMLYGGGAKVVGVPEMHQSFAMMGLPSWFGYFIGAAEVAAAIGLWIPRLSAWAAAGLVPIMIGAAYFHIAFEIPSATPALVFIGIASYVVAWMRKQALWLTPATDSMIGKNA
ncbi:DoxX family protein [Paraferrimonas sedimenticola]|uniref:DoxX-like family protein n=1 Tax=Paraferrimonas sedimenticola TaxID=375674 RepID=A0AA37RZ38_9GAMM|nr:DoxX family protein [Paraferrimonas sedimenticola]GLP97604.1 hypothetical protein GCM10007895_29110 [Paraferrimonas sedimenticola]